MPIYAGVENGCGMTAKTTAERQQSYHRRMIAKGFKKVAVYIPPACVKKLREIAAKMRLNARKR